MAKEPFLDNPFPFRRRRHRMFGNPLSVLGMNPHRRHRRKYRRNPAAKRKLAPVIIMSGAKRRGRPKGRYKSYRARYKHYRSRARHAMKSYGLKNVTKALPIMATAGVSSIVTQMSPNFVAGILGPSLMSNQWVKYGVQIGSGLLGASLVGKWLGKDHATVWLAVAGGVVVADLFGRYLIAMLTPAPAAAAGMGFFPSRYPGVTGYGPAGVGAFVRPGFKGIGFNPYGASSKSQVAV